MKRFLVILTLYTFISNGQNPLNKTYKGLSDGEKIDYYSNKQIRTKLTIKNGNVVGQHINYFKDGKLMSIEVFDNGQFNGTNFTLNKNGDTLVTEKYKHDTLLYYKEFRYYKTGQLKIVMDALFKDSLTTNSFTKSKDGFIYVQYDINKVIGSRYNENTYKKYYKSGKLLSTYFGIRGKYNGQYTEFFENGKIRVISNYVNSKLDGEYIEYNEKGEIIKKLKYKSGQII